MNNNQEFRVVECTHADTLSLVALNRYQSLEHLDEHALEDSRILALLRDRLSAAGYNLVKKPAKKVKS